MAEINWRTFDECVPCLRFAPQVTGWMVHCLWPWNAEDCTEIMCRSSRLIRSPSVELHLSERVDQLDATCKNFSSVYILLRGGQPVSIFSKGGTFDWHFLRAYPHQQLDDELVDSKIESAHILIDEQTCLRFSHVAISMGTSIRLPPSQRRKGWAI